jgi:hypothetical protein
MTAQPMHAVADDPFATPFGWQDSGLEPLPWFPFTVAASRGHTDAAGRIAQRAERAYWCLRRLFGFTPRFRLLALAPGDWSRFATLPAYGSTHFTADGHLVVGTEPAAAWHDVSRFLASRLPQATLRNLVRIHGRDRVHPDGPDLSGVADTLIAHELAHVIADQAGATFPRRWLAEAFANYALVTVLAETDLAGLQRVGTLAEAVLVLGDTAPSGGALDHPDGALDPVPSVLAQLALTRGVMAAYAHARSRPLARWFALARVDGKHEPDADHELGRMLARDVHPELGRLAARCAEWYGAEAKAA